MKSCEQSPDEKVFRQFTVLPRPTRLADLGSSNAPELLATLDGGDNLVVPLAHTTWLPDTTGSHSAAAHIPVAIFERAWGRALNASALASAPNRDELVRAFTLDGRLLPPLLSLRYLTRVPVPEIARALPGAGAARAPTLVR